MQKEEDGTTVFCRTSRKMHKVFPQVLFRNTISKGLLNSNWVEQLMHMQETIKVTGFTQNEQVSLNCLCCKTFSILFLLISWHLITNSWLSAFWRLDPIKEKYLKFNKEYFKNIGCSCSQPLNNVMRCRLLSYCGQRRWNLILKWLTFTGEGKRVRHFRLQQYDKRAEIRANFRDTLEQQGGQDIGNQQNSNPQQGKVHML